MKIIRVSLSPFLNLFRDLKNNLTLGKFVWFFVYCLFALYTGQIIDRVVGSGNVNTQLLLGVTVSFQELPVLLFVFFYFKRIYLKLIESRGVGANSISLDNSLGNIRLLRVVLFSIFILYLPFVFLKTFYSNSIYNAFFIIKMFLLLIYILILPRFILTEKPSASKFLSLRIIGKVVVLQSFKLLLIIFIISIIFEIICIPLYYFPQGYMAYLVVVSNGQDATTGMMIAVTAICNFITVYIGIILYAKLSIRVYLSFRNRILYEMKKSEK